MIKQSQYFQSINKLYIFIETHLYKRLQFFVSSQCHVTQNSSIRNWANFWGLEGISCRRLPLFSVNHAKIKNKDITLGLRFQLMIYFCVTL